MVMVMGWCSNLTSLFTMVYFKRLSRVLASFTMSHLILMQKVLVVKALALPEGLRLQNMFVKPKSLMCWMVKHRWTCLPLLLVAMGSCLIIIDSLCICLLAFGRVLLNLVGVSFKCRDINTEVWGVFCDCSYWMMNDEDAYKVVLRSISCKQWTPVTEAVHCGFLTKTVLAMMSEQFAEGENGVPLIPLWGQNEILEGLGRCLWHQEPGLMWSKCPSGRFAQFRPSILGSFWTICWKTLDTKTASKDAVCFRCVFGIEIWWKIDGFWAQIRTKGRWYFTISSEMRKIDFWTTVHVFWRFLLFSPTLGSRVLEAKIDFETKLQRHIDLRLIFDGFGDQTSLKIGSNIDEKVMLNTKSFSRQFLGAECPSLSRSDWPHNDVQGGVWGNQRREQQCHTPLKPHFMG